MCSNNHLNHLWESLKSEKTAAMIGFTSAFIDSISSTNSILEKPLTNVLIGSLNGGFYGMCAAL